MWPSTVEHIVDLMVAIEVPDMVQIVDEAFQCLNVFNLDLRKVYDQVSDLLYLRRKFLTVERGLNI